MTWVRQAAEHDADHRKTDEGGSGSAIAFEIAGHAAKPADPGKCSLHDPPLGQNFKTDGGSRTFDDLDSPSTCSRGCFRGLRPSITAVTVDALDKGKQPTRAAVQHQRNAVTILYAGRMHCHVQQQAEGIDENVPLATLDLLARIKALRIERSPPFCAPLALWLSIIAVVGLAPRPACSRTAT